VHAKEVDNRGHCPEVLEKINKIQGEIRRDFDKETLADCPKIQNWRKAYKAFGAKPKKHQSSVENLYRMTLEGSVLRSINTLVDIYNCVSLKHMVPIGGDDLAQVEGDIVLRFAKGEEPFFPLGSKEMQKARAGEVIYADEREVLCRRWNWRESEKTKMSEETQDVLLVCEGLPPLTAEDIRQTAKDLGQMVKNHCGGEIEIAELGIASNEFEL